MKFLGDISLEKNPHYMSRENLKIKIQTETDEDNDRALIFSSRTKGRLLTRMRCIIFSAGRATLTTLIAVYE